MSAGPAARRHVLLLGSGALLLAGCAQLRPGAAPAAAAPGGAPAPGGGPAPLRARTLQLDVAADAALNPDPTGRPSPLALRLLQLRSATAFSAAGFFALFDAEAATLGPELVAREELALLPGSETRLQRVLAPETTHLAVFAAFRDFDRARWRALLPLAASEPWRVRLRASGLAISLDEA